MKGWLKIHIVLAVVALTVVSGIALAARQGGSTASVSLVRFTDTARVASSSDPVFGEQVTFELQTSISRPYVLNECRRDGVLLSSELHGFYDGNVFGTTFSLGPTTVWQGGEADCTASLVDQSHPKTKVLATTTFHVAAA